VSHARRSAATYLLPLALFVGVFGMYFLTSAKSEVNVDAYAASAGSWRIATAGTPWMDGLDVKRLDATHGDDDRRNGQWISESPNGHVTAQRMAGPIIVGVPFYWLFADGDQEEDFDLRPAALASSVLTAGTVLLLFLALRHRASPLLATAGALLFAFATPTWLVSANGLWTHTVTQLGIAGAAYAAARDRWWLVGALLGVGIFGRPHVAVIAAVVGLGVAWSRRDWRVAAKVALPSAAALGLLTGWNRWVHGVWSIGGAYGNAAERAAAGVGGYGFDQLANYLGFFVSFNRGLLVWTPVILLLLPAMIRARRSLPHWSLWLIAGGVLYTFFQLRLNHYTGGIFFHGYRHGLELLTCLVPALVWSAPGTRRVARWLLGPVIALQVGMMTALAPFESAYVIEADAWRDNSLWMLLRAYPGPIGGWLVLSLLLGVLVSARYLPRPPGREPATVPLARTGSSPTD
jgi:alpha-1,2-mannosyltransferase